MNIWQKIKLLWKVKNPAEKLIDGLYGFKSGWKTWEFWATLLGSLGSVAAALQGVIPAEASLLASTILAGLYNLARASEKMEQNATRPLFQSTEFWISVVAAATGVLTDLKAGGIDPAWMTSAMSALGIITAFAQNMGVQRSNPERLTQGDTNAQ